MWAQSFVIPNVILWVMRGEDEVTARMMLITVPVFIWASRLTWYIIKRKKSEDWRYKEMRDKWEGHGDALYYLISFFVVYILKGIFSDIHNA